AGPSAKKKDIAIERNLDTELFYICDETFLRQLFLIFLDNAVNYSPPHTRFEESLMESKNLARAAFKDKGRGNSDEHLPHIFERFYRGSQQSSEDPQSGGLGLAIAKAIVGAEGGSINCQTVPGAGTTFTINLPIRREGLAASSQA